MKKIFIKLIGLFYNIFIFCVGVFVLFIPWVDTIQNFFEGMILVFLFVIGLAIMFMFINSFFTGKRFDKKFKDKLLSDPYINDEIYTLALPGSILINLRSIRAILYSFCMVFPNLASKYSRYRNWFNGYNFRENAGPIDLLFSYLFLVCNCLILIILFSMPIVKWLS